MLFRAFTLLAVIALGIGTWILSSPARKPQQDAGAGRTDLPGYYLKNAVLTDYDAAGAPSIRIVAERIDQIAHSTEVALSNVQVNYQAPGGQPWLLVGDTARVEPGADVVDVNGNVRLQGEPAPGESTAVMHTDALSYNVPASVATTQSDVRIDFGGHTLTARGMVANLKDRTIRLESKVNGRFQP
jgi:lipopolysaccharide export system protein LptC